MYIFVNTKIYFDKLSLTLNSNEFWYYFQCNSNIESFSDTYIFFSVFSLICSQKSYIVFDMLFKKKKMRKTLKVQNRIFVTLFLYRKNKFTKIDIYCYMVLKIIGKRIYGKDRKTRCFIYLF